MKGWHYLFEDRILARGLSYTDMVEVTYMDDEKVRAIVSGTEDYGVEITFENGLVDEMSCSCPYFNTDNCKHLAALLFVLEDDGVEVVVEGEDFTELFNSVSEDDLRQFLFSELEGNPELLNRFKLKFSDKINADYYRCKLDDICFLNHNREPINDFLRKDMHFLLDKGEYGLVLELLDDVFPYIKDWWNYWEDYGSDGNMEEFHDIVKALIPTGIRDDVFEFLGELIYAIPSDDHMDDLIDLYFSEFEREDELEEKMALAEMLYRKTKKVRWISLKIDLMGKLDYPDDEIDCFREKYLDNEEILAQYIADSTGDKKEELLLKAIGRFDFNRPYKVQLKDHYLETGNGRYLETMEDLVLSYPDIEYYTEFKITFDGDWQAKRSEILDHYSDLAWFLDECYAVEGMYDLLIGNIRQLWDLDRYYGLLVEDYSDELIGKYCTVAVNMASRSGSPKHYRDIADVLKRIQKIPGGEEKAAELAEEFKVKYKRRPRMIEALRNAGF